MRFIVDMGEVALVVTYSFTPEVRAKVNCLPDDARPGESAEIELESAMSRGADYLPLLKASVVQDLEERALSHAVESAIDFAEQAADYNRSQREEF